MSEQNPGAYPIGPLPGTQDYLSDGKGGVHPTPGVPVHEWATGPSYGAAHSIPLPPKRYTLQEAHAQIERITREVANLLYVAAVDLDDVYGYDADLGILFGAYDQPPTGIAKQFAEQLVLRLLHTPEITLDWTDTKEPE